MISGHEWKQVESMLRANEGLKLPTIRTGTPQKQDAKKSSIPGSRGHRPHRSQSEVAEEVARIRFGGASDGVPTLGLFKSSYLKNPIRNNEVLIESQIPNEKNKTVLEFTVTKPTPSYYCAPEEPTKDYREPPKYLGISERHLPLDLFVEEPVKYEELMKEGRENEEKKCKGRTRFEYANGKTDWIPVEILSFDEETKRFHIKIIENAAEKHVRRYNLLFDIEDEDEFFSRREKAIELRNEARKRLTKELFIAGYMKNFYQTEGMDLKTIEGVYSRLGINLEQYPKESVEKYLLQIHAMHDYSILKANFNYFYNEPHIQNALKGFDIDPPSPKQIKTKRFYANKENYMRSVGRLQKYALVSNNFMMGCLQDIQDCYLTTISKKNMFEFPTSEDNSRPGDSYDLPIVLKDFIRMQYRVIKNFKKQANEAWTVKSGECIRKRLSTIMNLDNKSMTHDSIKPEIKKLLRLIKFRMEAMANECLDKSLRSFEEFVMSFSARKAGAFKHNDKRAQKSPFINVNIVIGVNKKTGIRTIETDPPLEGIIQDLWSIPLKMCDALSNLEAVEQWVFAYMLDNPVTNLVNPDLESHPFLSKIATSVKLILRNAIMNVERMMEKLKKYEYILNSNIEEIKKQINQLSDHLAGESESIKSEGLFERKIAEFLLKLVKDYWEIRQVFVGYYDFGMISVYTEQTRQVLISEAETLQKPIISILTDDIKKDIIIFTQQFEYMREKAAKNCTSIDEVSETLEFLSTAGKEVEELKKKVWESSRKYENLIELSIQLESPYIEKYIALFHWPKFLLEFFSTRMKELAIANEALVKEMNDQKDKIQGIITEFAKDFEQFKTYGRKNKQLPVDYVEELAEKAKLLKARLKSIKEETDVINRRETLLGFEISQYRDLNKLIEFAEPYFEVWKLGNDFKKSLPVWFESSISRLNIEKVYNSVSFWVKSLSRLEELFLNSKRHLKVVKVLFSELEDFRAYLPLITSLTTQGLRDRHWKEFREKLRISLSPDLVLSLSDLISLELHQPAQLTIITEIAERAAREMTIEKTLDALDAEWSAKEFNLLKFKDIYLLTHAEDLQLQVDDNIMKVQTLRSSPFVAPFRDKVMNWEKNLRQITDLLNEWVRVQKYWLYLEPIFGSKDMSSQMQAEAKKFSEVDADIRKMISIVYESKSVLAVACSEMSIAYFVQCNEGCEKILRSLRHYLEVKRTIFPRFYFLSDDEMLDLQSHTQNPRSVQKQLHKCFPAVATVMFSDDNCVIGLRSLEKEELRLVDSIIPKLSLEIWLNQIESSMIATIKGSINSAFQAPKRRYHEWPSQANFEAQNLLWTMVCSRIIQGDGFAVLYEELLEEADDIGEVPRRNAPRTSFFNEYKRRIEKEVVKLVALVRTSYQRALRNSYSNQAQLLINQRDNIESILQVTSEDEFAWQVIIKHYLENNTLFIRSMNRTFKYRYEYLGTTQRLVITPLTARAQSSLLLATSLRFAGSPEGPAGTGKTETTKELARIMAVYCLVFNCSEGVDAFAMASFFKGLAICGAWSCFDEFNRIDSEVLSVVSQQILSISMAMRASIPEMEFEGVSIKLNPGFAIFATMNPFYKGRTQLPDSIKSLLRPVSMTQPDFLMIAQISLYSFGFRLAKTLSFRIITVFKLCDEQLSTQDHYEFGLRTLKSVLIAASNLRARAHADSKVPMSLIRRFTANSASHEALVNSGKITDDKTALAPDVELSIIVRSLFMCNKPKLVDQDEEIFKNILEDVFPGVKFNEMHETDLHKIIDNIIKENKYSTSHEFTKKVYQVYETLAVRHGIMLVGESMTGKTTTLSILHEALNRLKANELADRLMIWTRTEARNEESEYYKALITSFKELQIDIDTIEEMRFKEYLPFISLQELKSIRNQCEHPGVLQLSLNPKAHLLPRLFGTFDENTREWQDGLASSIMRKLMFEGTKRMKWLVFDGPIDIFWVENLNTALDDNKKLCLTSGETILIGSDMSLIFEVDSLEHASPATVSRCGMIFYDYSLVSVVEIFEHYTRKDIPELLKDYGGKLEQMFKWIAVPSLEITKKVALNFPATDQWLVSSFIKLLDALLNSFRNLPSLLTNDADTSDYTSDINIMANKQTVKDNKNTTGLSASALLIIEASFVFSAVWTFGALMADDKDREAYDDFIRERIGIEDLNDDLPSISSIRKNIVQSTAGMALNYFSLSPDTIQRPHFALPLKRKIKVFDMVYDKDRKDWIRFEEMNTAVIGDLGNEKDSPELMIVPTHDITKTFFLIETLADARKCLLLTGPTGTGKSVLLKQFIAKKLKSGDSITSMINFTATITSESFQKRIESKLERHRKGVLAPVLGKYLIIIAEDIHMASQDAQGVHPTLELLRQWFDYSGWFDMKFSDFRKLENLFYIAAMTPRLGNDKMMSSRILRHFALVTMGQPTDRTFHEIFETIYSEISKKFSERATRGIEDRIVGATLDLYRRVEEQFKPTPNRVHYTFNIRDVGNVFKGMSLCNPKTIRKKDNLIRLWYHEGLRIFYDRLVDDADRVNFLRIIDTVTLENFKSVRNI